MLLKNIFYPRLPLYGYVGRTECVLRNGFLPGGRHADICLAAGDKLRAGAPRKRPIANTDEAMIALTIEIRNFNPIPERVPRE